MGDAADKPQIDLYGIDTWLNAIALQDPVYALTVTEMYLALKRDTSSHLYDHQSNFTQLLTSLFKQAEEQEESDDGVMLQRVVALQDSLVALGMNGMDEWLKAFERQ